MTRVLRVLLADDEPLALERLTFAFRDIPDCDVVGTATNGVEAAAKIADLKPDLAILDIQMPGRSGLGVAACADDRRSTDIIFLTAYEHHAVDAFDVEAADYLLKPLRLDRLRQAIERVRRRRAARGLPMQPPSSGDMPDTDVNDFWVVGGDGLVRVPLQTIDWIEAAKDYVLLHTATRSHILRATMAAIEAKVPSSFLMRVHRSAFVRPGAVKGLHQTAAGGAVLILVDDCAVPVGPSYLHAVAARFSTVQPTQR